MMVAEQVNKKLKKLPAQAQEEVLHFVEFLAQKFVQEVDTGKELTFEQKAAAIERWAKSHSFETPVILDDRREIIYED